LHGAVVSLQNGIAALAGDAAESTCIPEDAHEAALAPILRVRVLDDPVVASIFRSIAHHGYRVIQFALIALLVLVDATAVLLKRNG